MPPLPTPGDRDAFGREASPPPDFRERWPKGGGGGFSRAKGADAMLPALTRPPLGPPYPLPPPTYPTGPQLPPKGTGLPLPTGHLPPSPTDWPPRPLNFPAPPFGAYPYPHRLGGAPTHLPDFPLLPPDFPQLPQLNEGVGGDVSSSLTTTYGGAPPTPPTFLNFCRV